MAQMAQQPNSAQYSSALPEESTLDESVFKTIGRDLMAIGRNLRSVLIPINWKFSNRDQALRNWDLWGPLIFMLLLASTLSWGEKESSQVFAMVFAECGIGAIILTLNAILLGGEIVFFQSLCLLGYCLFPICASAIVCVITANKIVRTLVLVGGLAWASLAALPFIGNAVPSERKALAVYPVILLYASLGWLGLVKAI